jgi:hypothetical protein
MLWTVILAVVGAILLALTTWLGFHIKASPDVLSDQKKVRKYRYAFAVLLGESIPFLVEIS